MWIFVTEQNWWDSKFEIFEYPALFYESTRSAMHCTIIITGTTIFIFPKHAWLTLSVLCSCLPCNIYMHMSKNCSWENCEFGTRIWFLHFICNSAANAEKNSTGSKKSNFDGRQSSPKQIVFRFSIIKNYSFFIYVAWWRWKHTQRDQSSFTNKLSLTYVHIFAK